MRTIDFIQQWKKDETIKFKGWNFSYIKTRYNEGKPNWNYNSIAKRLINRSNSVLDMATGGGEVFSEILSKSKATKTVAIEGFKPNVSVARNNLREYGVNVVYAPEQKKLPFKKNEFDLVLNRHGGLRDISELARVLSVGGMFLTQQVDGRNLKDLMKEFGAKPKWEFNTLSKVKNHLKHAGFEILQEKEWTGKTIFKDVGALVYFLKAIPWLVDDFSVKKYKTVLEKLQKKIEARGRLECMARRFLILAKKK